jgi:opacity protein-like surface antigen
MFRGLLLSSVALVAAMTVAATTSAFAADLKPIRKAPAAAVALTPSWKGFYAGPTLGWATGKSEGFYQGITPPPPSTTPSGPRLPSNDCDSVVSEAGAESPQVAAAQYFFCILLDPIAPGALAGYNFQFGNLIAGPEIDLGWIGAGGRTWAPDGSLRYDELRVTWYGHARARIGHAFGRYLLYVAGGFAFAGFEPSHFRSDATGTVLYTTHDTRVGYTIGGGVEIANVFPSVLPGWVFRGEYLYDHFNSKQYDWVPGMRYSVLDLSIHTLRGAVTYRFPAPH